MLEQIFKWLQRKIIKNSKKSKDLTIIGMIDGEPVNRNPITKMPTSEMTLYGINGIYFETEEELREYCQRNELLDDQKVILDYFRRFADCKDVIRKTDGVGKSTFYTVVDEEGYGVYNQKRSIYRGEFTWEYHYGKIDGLYSVFRQRGISFEDDIYHKISDRNEQCLRSSNGISVSLDKEKSNDLTIIGIIDGEPVNRNPVTKMPISEMTLYGINGIYFETEEELREYCQRNELLDDQKVILDYFRRFADCKDVIRKTDGVGKSTFYTVVDEEGYGVYNQKRSIYRGEFTWEYHYGKIDGLYSAFRQRNISFDNDINRQGSDKNKQLLKAFIGKKR